MSKTTTSLKLPDLKELLKTGLQFGHNSSKWNPKMSEYIYSTKNGIHVIDVVKTQNLLEEAINELKDIAAKSNVIFVATKRQAADIVEEQAKRAGAYYIVNRWPGGLFTNLKMVTQSLSKLRNLEKQFEEGVEGRTKYEITQMKNEWSRLNRLYRGVKTMEKLPGAVVVIDPGFEKVAIREAKLLNIPIFALTDTNCDPDDVDFIIPGNDDALKSIELIINTLADAVLTGNGGKGVKHTQKDYSDADVDRIKVEVEEDEAAEAVAVVEPQAKIKVSAKSSSTESNGKGILEKVKEEADKK